eukprot:962220-Pelagomonas_calceolata.AAC.2
MEAGAAAVEYIRWTSALADERALAQPARAYFPLVYPNKKRIPRPMAGWQQEQACIHAQGILTWQWELYSLAVILTPTRPCSRQTRKSMLENDQYASRNGPRPSLDTLHWCDPSKSSQAADGHMSLEPKRAHTYENSHANWAINRCAADTAHACAHTACACVTLYACSMPDALDEAYKVHVLGSSMGVDFVFDDEEEDGGMGLRGSSGSDEDEGGEVEVRDDSKDEW